MLLFSAFLYIITHPQLKFLTLLLLNNNLFPKNIFFFCIILNLPYMSKNPLISCITRHPFILCIPHKLEKSKFRL